MRIWMSVLMLRLRLETPVSRPPCFAGRIGVLEVRLDVR